MANGAFMLATGVAFIVVALVLYKMAKKPVEQ
jgi:F0F1-type ATP synthase membrane subunit b/b'